METSEKQSLFMALKEVFGNTITFSEGTIEIEDKELIETMNNVDKKGEKTEEPIHLDNKSSNNSGKSGGLGNKIKTPTIDAQEMSQEKLERMKKKLQKGRAIGE